MTPVKETWSPIHNIWGTGGEPTFENLVSKLEPFICKSKCTVEDITAEDIRRRLAKTKSSRAAGACGWRAREMKCLPLVLLEPIAQWWKAMEIQCVKGSTDVWPFVTLLARGKCLEKGEGSSPSKIRIVRVMSLLYTLYTVCTLCATWHIVH